MWFSTRFVLLSDRSTVLVTIEDPAVANDFPATDAAVTGDFLFSLSTPALLYSVIERLVLDLLFFRLRSNFTKAVKRLEVQFPQSRTGIII